MIVAKIDRDYINKGTEYDRTGKTFELHKLHSSFLPDAPQVRFRVKDDDGEIYQGGWLLNDNECEVQLEVLRYCQRDTGCTTIEVKLNGKWTQEIG